MSELQIALMIIGAVVVAGVYGFNWVQQRKYQRSAERAFESRHEDVLLGAGGAAASESERVEPRLSTEPAAFDQIVPPAGDAASESYAAVAGEAADWLDKELDYLAEIRLKDPVAVSALAPLAQHKFDFEKPVQVLGWSQTGGRWEEVGAEPGSSYARVKVALQLVDRAGPVPELKLAEFRDMVRDVATQLKADADCPDLDEAFAQATLLDGFCAEVDVMIGLNVVSRDGNPFAGTKIRAMAEAAGFKLAPDGSFRYLNERGEQVYSLQNLEPSPFASDVMKALATRGITLLLDVPRVATGGRVFDQMVSLARHFSSTLGGTVVDDNRVVLNEGGLAKIRAQIEDIQARMTARGVRPGSPLALRLFG